MRIASGVTDQFTYFIARDTAGSRVTGLSGFTVYRSRNGGAAAAFTTPTINETDASNMPGVYELLLDEDMTIDAGDETQAMVVHITVSGMVAVTKEFELYRPKITAGVTLSVESDGDLTKVNTLDGHTAQTGDSYALGNGASGFVAIKGDTAAILLDTAALDGRVPSDPADASDIASAFSTVNSTLGTIAGYIDTEIGTLQTSVNDLPTNSELATALAGADDAMLAALATAQADLDILTGTDGVTLATAQGNYAPAKAGDLMGLANDAITAAKFDESTAFPLASADTGSTAVARTGADSDTLETLSDEIAGISAGSGPTVEQIADEVQTRTIARVTLVDTVTTNTDMRGTDSAALATDLATLDGKADDIKAKTDSLAFTVAGQVDANIQAVNNVTVTGTGTTADPWYS